MPDTATSSGVSQPVQIGSYRLVEPLGSGGMSSVFRAVHVETEHEVALKLLTRSLAKDSTLLQRFLREAKSAEALQHPNIVAIYDRGSEAGRYYLALEYVPGGDLHDRVRTQGPLSVAEAVRIVRGCAEGLRYAAAQGVIHRDIKPANILLTREGEAKLADLGLALQVEEEDERVTRDGTTVGTVDYMSPEQARDSRAISARSDMYSLGCTFYHLLAGAAPFAGGDVPEKLRRHAQEPPPDVRRVRADVPLEVGRLIQRMMAKKPDARFKDYDELIATIDALPPLPSTVEGEPLFALLEDDDAPLPVVHLGSAPIPAGSTGEMQPGTGSQSGMQRPVSSSLPNLDLIELAALDDGPASSKVTPKPKPPVSATTTPARPASHPTALFDDDEEPGSLADEEPDDDYYGPGPLGAPRRSAYDDDALRQWIIRGLLIGAAVVLVAIGIDQLWRLQRSYSTGGPVIPTTTSGAPSDDSGMEGALPSPAPAGESSF